MRHLLFLMFGFLVMVSMPAHAATTGWQIGANLGFINADQDDMNAVIDATNQASSFGNAWEVNGMIGYRFSDWSVLFRPGYFFYPAEEGGTSEYSMSGFSFFPMLRYTMLESQAIQFYTHFGVGFGSMTGTIKEGSYEVEFSGSASGYIAGLGAEFCFAGSHCLNVEGNVRAMAVNRTEVDKVTGTATNPLIDQDGKGQEFEINDRDFAMSMSGVLAMVGYTLHF